MRAPGLPWATDFLLPADAVREALARIDERDRDIRAWVFVDRNGGRRLRVRSGSELAGLPFGVKDTIDVAGQPTCYGLTREEIEAQPAARSAAAVRRLQKHSAVPVGKTATTALALDRPSRTRNPHDPRRSPGASSSGSAAAVGAGMVPFALGAQTVGSVIRPASYCGVWGYVPTHGLVPAEGCLVLSEMLDRVGLFAGTSGYLVRAAQRLVDAPEGHERTTPAILQKSRIGVLRSDQLKAMAPEPCRHLAELTRRHGDWLRPAELDLDLHRILTATLVIAAHELHGSVNQSEGIWHRLSRPRLISLAPPDPGVDAYAAARALRTEVEGKWSRLAGEYDAVLLPSAAGEAPLGLRDDQDPAPAALASLLGLPAISIPLWTSEIGLPLGCQLIAPRYADLEGLRIAGALGNLILDPRDGGAIERPKDRPAVP